MTRLAFIMATVCLGLAFALVPNLKIVEAQNPRTDSIRLMAATRGSNFDGSGLQWCVSQTWHLGAPGVTIMTSLDEVPHTASGCVSLSTEQAELAAYGQTVASRALEVIISDWFNHNPEYDDVPRLGPLVETQLANLRDQLFNPAHPGHSVIPLGAIFATAVDQAFETQHRDAVLTSLIRSVHRG